MSKKMDDIELDEQDEREAAGDGWAPAAIEVERDQLKHENKRLRTVLVDAMQRYARAASPGAAPPLGATEPIGNIEVLAMAHRHATGSGCERGACDYDDHAPTWHDRISARILAALAERGWGVSKEPSIPVDAIKAIKTLPHITVTPMRGLWVSLDQVVALLEAWTEPAAQLQAGQKGASE